MKDINKRTTIKVLKLGGNNDEKIKRKKNKTKKIKSKKYTGKNRNNSTVFRGKDYRSGDGMLTSVWGPGLWHYLHTMSFNYPVNPTKQDKDNYKKFIIQLQYVLPCKYCRDNLKKNLKYLPLTNERMRGRESFSRYIYELHEHINEMLGKHSGLSYIDVRDRYEHFRSRCNINNNNKSKTIKTKQSSKKTKEKGCTNPLYGSKSKCVIKIVPHDTICDTFQMDDKCKMRKYSK